MYLDIFTNEDHSVNYQTWLMLYGILITLFLVNINNTVFVDERYQIVYGDKILAGETLDQAIFFNFEQPPLAKIIISGLTIPTKTELEASKTFEFEGELSEISRVETKSPYPKNTFDNQIKRGRIIIFLLNVLNIGIILYFFRKPKIALLYIIFLIITVHLNMVFSEPLVFLVMLGTIWLIQKNNMWSAIGILLISYMKYWYYFGYAWIYFVKFYKNKWINIIIVLMTILAIVPIGKQMLLYMIYKGSGELWTRYYFWANFRYTFLFIPLLLLYEKEIKQKITKIVKMIKGDKNEQNRLPS